MAMNQRYRSPHRAGARRVEARRVEALTRSRRVLHKEALADTDRRATVVAKRVRATISATLDRTELRKPPRLTRARYST